MNTYFKKYVLNQKLSLVKMLKKVGVYIPTYGTCLCPFHGDTTHRSAKLYLNDKKESLYCFAESKHFYASDVITNIYEESIDKYFDAVWGKLDSKARAELEIAFSQPVESISKELLRELYNLKKEFKEKKSFTDFSRKLLYVLEADL
jgi:hypothetical protein